MAFRLATTRFRHRLQRKWWFVFLFIIWELAKDRVAAWANSKIDEEAGAIVTSIAQAIEYLASTSLAWTISVAILVVLFLFVHSYLSAAAEKANFISDEQTIVRSSSLTVAHHFDDAPTQIQAMLICRMADSGYEIGEEIIIGTGISGISIIADTKAIITQFGDEIEIPAQTYGQSLRIDPRKWRIKFFAWK